MPKVEQREDRSMTLRAKERAQDDAAGFIVEGYCTTYNDPYELYSRDGITVMEQVAPGAFDNADVSESTRGLSMIAICPTSLCSTITRAMYMPETAITL